MNLIANQPNAVVATQTATFATIGFNANNVSIVYELGNSLKSWVPGRSINSINGITEGVGYYVIPKIDMDIPSYFIPPNPSQSVPTEYAGEAKPSTNPPVTSQFQRWISVTAGTYTNFKDQLGVALVISPADVANGSIVEFWGQNGVWVKHVFGVDSANVYTKTESDAKFLAGVKKKTGTNLFNQADPDFTPNSYVNNNSGTILPDASNLFSSTGFIPVVAGQQYTVTWKNGLAWYDVNKVFISGNPSSDTNKTQTAPTTPTPAAYVRLTAQNSSLATYMFVLGNKLPTTYEAFLYRLADDSGVPLAAYVPSSDVQKINEANTTKPMILAYAPKFYAVVGSELAIYFENIHRNADAYADKTTFDYTTSAIAPVGAGVATNRSFKITPVGIGTIGINISVGKGDFTRLKSFELSNIIVTDINKTTPVKILNIGDSYTQGSIYTRFIMGKAAKTGITFLGTKKAEQAPEWPTNAVKTQGIGGFKLVDMTVINKNTFVPLVQPASTNSYLYYGNTAHWKEALNTPGYLTKDYLDEIKALYSATTGYKLSPNNNDVIYDNVQQKFYYWNATTTAWTEVLEATLNFGFNFSKYLQLYGIATPDIVNIQFGTNDQNFNNDAQAYALMPTFKSNMDMMISNIKQVVPAVKIIISLPTTSGMKGNTDDLITGQRKRAFHIHNEYMLANYAGREAEGILCLDFNSIIDRRYSFGRALIAPHASYTGTLNVETNCSDPVHVNIDGYGQYGPQIAAGYQFFR